MAGSKSNGSAGSTDSTNESMLDQVVMDLLTISQLAGGIVTGAGEQVDQIACAIQALAQRGGALVDSHLERIGVRAKIGAAEDWAKLGG